MTRAPKRRPRLGGVKVGSVAGGTGTAAVSVTAARVASGRSGAGSAATGRGVGHCPGTPVPHGAGNGTKAINQRQTGAAGIVRTESRRRLSGRDDAARGT
ncbi:hypothetical protein GCM10010169_25520 [Micromonospora fulviviridis]|nr:hypothetical protein GCM10010169_25520 [Micromonospora fulviviridis]